MENLTFTKLRTIQGFVDEVHKEDPNSAITYSFVKRYVDEGVIPCIRNGTRIYLSYDRAISAITDYFRQKEKEQSEEEELLLNMSPTESLMREKIRRVTA